MDLNYIDDDEMLYRCIRKSDPNVFRDGKPLPGLFFDKKGASVSRDGGREEREILQQLSKKVLKDHKSDWGGCVKIKAKDCRRVETYLAPIGNKKDIFHAEIHESKEEVIISLIKAILLCRYCQVLEASMDE